MSDIMPITIPNQSQALNKYTKFTLCQKLTHCFPTMSRKELSDMVVTSNRRLFQLNLLKTKQFSVVSHVGHVSEAQDPQAVIGHHIGQHEQRTAYT